VDAVEYDPDQAKVSLLRVPDCPGIAAKLFGEIAHQGIDVDLIIQSIHEGNSNDIAFTVVKKVLGKAEAVAEAIAPALRSHPSQTQEAEALVEKRVAKVAIAGAGMIGRPGIAAKMFKTLADVGVNIEMIATSEVKVSCVIDEAEADRAIGALSQAFGISLAANPICNGTANLPPVRGVAIDQNQAQIAIRHVPDKPGMAAKIFMKLAEHNISVDMIIQSQRCRIINQQPTRDIAFIIAQADIHTTQAVLEKLAQQIGSQEVVVNPDIAKVSIVGAGMAGQPGVAAKFFDALAKEGINIEMIATSEIKISCVVPKSEGVRAVKVVHDAFALAGLERVQVPA
jgi:aspartate kinase